MQQDTTGHRGRKGDPLDGIQNILRAGPESFGPTDQRLRRGRSPPVAAVFFPVRFRSLVPADESPTGSPLPIHAKAQITALLLLLARSLPRRSSASFFPVPSPTARLIVLQACQF